MVVSAMADACRTRERGLRDEWMLPQTPPPDYGRGGGLPAVVTGILFNRGIRDDEIGPFLKPDVASMHQPGLMRDMPEAVGRLRLACAAGETILVNGDFDVDGVTAALVLAETLEALGASVLVHFPDRDTDGHGLQPDTVDRYRAHGVSVIVTADCGLGSRAAAERAAVLAMDLVITDHHPLGAGPLPRALAVVNPRRGDCPYPFKDLSGAAVAFKVASMLVSDRPDAAYLRRSVLDLVTLGVIADCVPLQGENRILVRYGLPLLGATARPGLRALIQTVLPGVASLTAGDVARTIAPPLNAPGRMPVAGGARLAYDLLAAPQGSRVAPSIAQVLRVNDGRKEAVARVVEEARRMLGPAPDQLPLIAFSTS